MDFSPSALQAFGQRRRWRTARAAAPLRNPPCSAEGIVDDRTPADRFDFITFVVAVLSLPGLGPFCPEDCVGYPYTDIAAHIPRDFLWIYPALFVAPLFVMLLTAIHVRRVHVRGRGSAGRGARGLMSRFVFDTDTCFPR